MKDKELLELAAKAAGITDIVGHDYNGLHVKRIGACWNPLTDDGDALRLAVDLAGQHPTFHQIVWNWTGRGIRVFAAAHEGTGSDLYAATRCAIVYAAAELGKKEK